MNLLYLIAEHNSSKRAQFLAAPRKERQGGCSSTSPGGLSCTDAVRKPEAGMESVQEVGKENVTNKMVTVASPMNKEGGTVRPLQSTPGNNVNSDRYCSDAYNFFGF